MTWSFSRLLQQLPERSRLEHEQISYRHRLFYTATYPSLFRRMNKSFIQEWLSKTLCKKFLQAVGRGPTERPALELLLDDLDDLSCRCSEVWIPAHATMPYSPAGKGACLSSPLSRTMELLYDKQQGCHRCG